MKKYYERMKEIREDNDMNQTEVAKYLGIHQQTYSQYETGERVLPLLHLIKICELFHVSSDWILGLDEQEKEK